MLKRCLATAVMVQYILLPKAAPAAPLKPRLVVLTDIGPNDVEPDDHESMIRLLAHADLFEIEGLFATTGWNTGTPYPPNWKGVDTILAVIAAYEKDVVNLRKRSGQTAFLADESRQEMGYWPSPAYLRSRTMMGSSYMGTANLKTAANNPGSDKLIELADEDDPRPIWVAAWGGGHTLSQAIWKLQQTRTPDQVKAFLHKVRIYVITDQDKPISSNNNTNFAFSSHQWLRKNFSQDLMFLWDECAWLYQNSTGVSNWSQYATNIQGHGALGADYPKYRWGVEGDTPSFLHLLPNGLNDPNSPTQVGWGGYFVWGLSADSLTNGYVNHQGAAKSTCDEQEARFYPATFNNFAARMAWAKDGAGNRNPAVVVDGDSDYAVLTRKPQQGTSVTLDAAGTSDPDGNALSYKWSVLAPAGTYTQSVALTNETTSRVTVAVPANSAGKTFHVILEVTDNGTPALASYRRIVFEPTAGSTGIRDAGIRGARPSRSGVKGRDMNGRLLTARKIPMGERRP